METIRFIGDLYPKGILISATLPDLDWVWPEGNQSFHFRTKINNSAINVECSLNNYKPDALAEIHRRAFDLARTAANLACFLYGMGVTAVFKMMILPDGTPTTLLYNDPTLNGLANSCIKAGTIDTEAFGKIANMVVTNPSLFAALNDLIEPLTTPHVSNVNCGRALDRIRRLVASDLEPKNGWARMQKILNISQPYQEFISNASSGPRHGDPTFISGSVTKEVVRRTWIILDRYFEYIKRGGKENLTPLEFSLLV